MMKKKIKRDNNIEVKLQKTKKQMKRDKKKEDKYITRTG